jgi:hypothetical protein
MLRLLACLALISLTACEEKKAPRPVIDASVPTDVVRARVNGVPITSEQLAVRLGARAATATPAQKEAALQQAILAELQAQKALSLGYGLDVADGGANDARAIEFRRHELAKQYRLKELLEASRPRPSEVLEYFQQNEGRLMSESRVQVIAFDAKTDADAFLAAVAAGRAFDEAAQRLYPDVPEPKPWAAQTLTFDAVPPRFAAVLDALQPGQVSEFVPDLGGKGWVLKLVERKKNPALTFPKIEAALTAAIQERRFEARRLADEEALRAAAKIELLGN